MALQTLTRGKKNIKGFIYLFKKRLYLQTPIFKFIKVNDFFL